MTSLIMKYPGILFACSIAFVTLVVLDSIEAQIKSKYTSFDDFLADVKNTANSLLDYVRKIQALFCPDQPVCGPNGVLEKQEVLGTLPEVLTVDDLSVRLEEIPSFSGVCCLPCSCSDSCRQDDNCCPTKLLVSNNNETVLASKECIAATIRSYKNKAGLTPFHLDHMYIMTTNCFNDGINLTLLASCQSPDTESFSDIVPVTSLETGTTYWNRACAVCNSDADDVMEWSPTVIFRRVIPFFANSSLAEPYPDTIEELFKRITKPLFADIIYKPPVSMKDNICLRKEAVSQKYCETSSDETILLKPEWMFDSCRKFYNPVYGAGVGIDPSSTNLNIFCHICRNRMHLTAQKTICSFGTAHREYSGYLTTLLDYKPETERSGEYDIQDRCSCAEIFDPYLKLCRFSYCPAGEFRTGCECFQPFQNFSGLPVLLKMTITTGMDQTDLLTDTQLRKLRTALTKTIESTAEHSTAEIITMFQQENTSNQYYLCEVIVRSDPGHDTKLTMKPLLKYLDTGDKLDVNVGKFVLSAALTSKVVFWTEKKKTTNEWKPKAHDMEVPTSKFKQIYDNDAIEVHSEIRLGVNQVLSRLLYCTQLQLNDTEYFERSGLIIVNVTVPRFSVSDYYKISSTEVRVCADEYLRASKGSGKSCGVPIIKMSHGLVILSFGVAVLMRFLHV